MNKSESKYFNTALLMDQALVELLKEKELAYITVKEICKKAGVNRSTFYLHYETISDLLSEIMEHTMDSFVELFPKKPEDFVTGIAEAELDNLFLITDEYLKPYLEFIRKNQSLYKAAFNDPKALQTDKRIENIYHYVLFPIMERFHIPKEEQAYQADFYIRGCMAVIQRWVNGGCREAVEQIENIIIHCIGSGYERYKSNQGDQ